MLRTDPDFCDSTVTVTIPSALNGYLTYTEATTRFEIFIDDSTALAGATSTDYTIEIGIVVRDFDGVQSGTDSDSFTWTIKNPCIDDDFVVW